MKRISALICVIVMMVVAFAPASFATDDATGAANKSGFKIEKTSPENGKTDVAVDNFSVSIYFNKDVMPKNDKVKKANAKMFKLKSEDGVKIPVKVYYSDAEEGRIMVVADVDINDRKLAIKGDKEYTLTVKKDFVATDGTKFGHNEQIVLKTLNQQRSTIVYMVLMFLMMGGMIFFTVRSARKAEEKKNEEKTKKVEAVNPYKEAKRTGKSVQEIVEAQSKKKNKKEAEIERQQAEYAELEARIMAEIKKERNKRVSGPRPISAAGSSYKVKVVVPEEPKKSSKGTTNPKNKSGKNRNSKKHK